MGHPKKKKSRVTLENLGLKRLCWWPQRQSEAGAGIRTWELPVTKSLFKSQGARTIPLIKKSSSKMVQKHQERFGWIELPGVGEGVEKIPDTREMEYIQRRGIFDQMLFSLSLAYSLTHTHLVHADILPASINWAWTTPCPKHPIHWWWQAVSRMNSAEATPQIEDSWANQSEAPRHCLMHERDLRLIKDCVRTRRSLLGNSHPVGSPQTALNTI